MSYYRLYCINERGRFFKCEDFEAGSDEAAIERSAELRRDTPAELWCGARLVHAFRQATAA